MKVLVKGKETKPEPEVILELETSGGNVLVSDSTEDWNVIGFKEINGRLSFFRCAGIDDKRYNLDSEGRIEEVEE